MNPDELIAKLAELRETPAPEYVYDECGIAHKAIMAQRAYWLSQERAGNPIDDELPDWCK